VIGSMSVPYIYEDRVNEDDFVDAMVKMYDMSPKERAKLGKKGRAHVTKNYNFDNFKSTWVDTMTEIHEDNGSWETRKNYNSWESIEL
jgi:glycosyltransferase involved in cell wall biosynthesis